MNNLKYMNANSNFIYYRRFFYFFIFIFANITYLSTNVILPNAIDPKFFLDDYIPLIPSTIFIYHLWYPGILLLIFKLRFSEDLDELLKTLAISMTLCVIIYKLIPFKVTVRPEALGESISEKILQLTYMADAPTSSMPSSHVLLCCIVYYYAVKYKIYSLAILNFFIPIVTLTTKQHVILDVFVAIVFGYVILFFSDENKRNWRKTWNY